MDRYDEQDPIRWFPISKITFAALRERMKEEGVDEIICIPLMSHNNVVGLLYVTNDGAYKLGRGAKRTAQGHRKPARGFHPECNALRLGGTRENRTGDQL